MPPINIRYADLQDVNLIKNISWQTFFDTFHLHNTRQNMEMFLSENFNEQAIKKEMNNAKNTFILAYIKKKVAGYAKLSEITQHPQLGTSNQIEISRLYAAKENIGSGVGKALMNECIDLGKQKSKHILWLGVWEHNQKAIQFYRRWGFEKFSEQTFVLGHDKQNDWLMKKDILVEQ